MLDMDETISTPAPPYSLPLGNSALRSAHSCAPQQNKTTMLDAHLLSSSRPPADAFRRQGKAYQDEILEHKRTRNILEAQIEQRRALEQELWQCRQLNTRVVLANEDCRAQMRQGLESSPQYLQLLGELERERRIRLQLQSQMSAMYHQHQEQMRHYEAKRVR